MLTDKTYKGIPKSS